MKKVKAGIGNDCQLQVADAKMVASLQYVTDLHVVSVVMGGVEHCVSWLHKYLQGLAGFLTCLDEFLSLSGLMVDDVGKSSDFRNNSVFRRVAVVLNRLDLQGSELCCGWSIPNIVTISSHAVAWTFWLHVFQGRDECSS